MTEKELIEKLIAGIQEAGNITLASLGLYGYHLNGDLASWNEVGIEKIIEAEKAIQEYEKERE
jgi:hypothetical protein